MRGVVTIDPREVPTIKLGKCFYVRDCKFSQAAFLSILFDLCFHEGIHRPPVMCTHYYVAGGAEKVTGKFPNPLPRARRFLSLPGTFSGIWNHREGSFRRIIQDRP